jgi:uncharacterized membrane protein YoaK (UPF0700 family)
VTKKYPSVQATLLTIVAGIADSVGYLTMGGIFAANMTGNTVLAGISAADGHWHQAVLRFVPLVAFFIGAMLSRLLLIEAALLAVVGFLPIHEEYQLMIAALAMGLQASAITHFGTTAVSTVVVTSTLARMADALLDRMWFAEKRNLPLVATPRLLLQTWVGYLVGGFAGAVLLKLMALPLLVPAALLLVVVALI